MSGAGGGNGRKEKVMLASDRRLAPQIFCRETFFQSLLPPLAVL